VSIPAPGQYSRVVHWFRRDLRLRDNTALHHAARSGRELVPVYITSDWSAGHLWTGAPRQDFLCGCLHALAQSVDELGGRLIIRRGKADVALRELLTETRAEALFLNRDPDPFGRGTEHRLEKLCRELGIAIHSYKDTVLNEAPEILTNAGDPYRVYTPYSRKWLAKDKDPPLPAPSRLATPSGLSSDPLPTLDTWGLPAHDVTLPEPGEGAARKRLRTALRDRLARYQSRRDLPAVEGTSRLSQDLRFGTLSVRTIHQSVHKAMADAPPTVRPQFETYLKELAWREFYMQLLHHFPHVLEHEFNERYRGLPWDEPGKRFEAWKTGTTGFPIVDAGMRELAATGFMHNRVRMITAMFLTKDLHLDWRLGEQFFMQSLVDGEIASNNGGWQWSAGTGADAAPYFRIQNPWSQTKRYDPKGDYIRKWVPELAEVPAKALFTAPDDGSSVALGYPAPIVDHATERNKTLAIFKRHLAEGR